MRFRQDQLTFEEAQTGLIIVGLAEFIVSLLYNWKWMVIGVFLIATFITNFRKPCVVITINELGIICQMKDELIWKFKWEDIAFLERGYVLRHPAIRIRLKDEETIDAGKLLSYYFQLGDEAIEALKSYGKCPIVNDKRF